ncbi:MAG TPA: hypothetical protein V6C81_11555 [Planktothrix sp.]|jgi:hypothetical protein
MIFGKWTTAKPVETAPPPPSPIDEKALDDKVDKRIWKMRLFDGGQVVHTAYCAPYTRQNPDKPDADKVKWLSDGSIEFRDLVTNDWTLISGTFVIDVVERSDVYVPPTAAAIEDTAKVWEVRLYQGGRVIAVGRHEICQDVTPYDQRTTQWISGNFHFVDIEDKQWHVFHGTYINEAVLRTSARTRPEDR